MKNLSLLLLVAVAFASCKTEKEVAKPTTLNNSTDSISYALGINIGQTLKQQGVDSLNTDLLGIAIMQGLKNDTTAMMKNDVAVHYLQTYFMKKQQEKTAKNLEEGKKFLEETGKKPGVITTASGLEYEVLQEGTGASPKDGDNVQVNYSGSLINGNVFDNSQKHGGPVILNLGKVVPGWSEALKLMKEGSKYKIYIPSNLAWGTQGAGQDIPPNSVVIFEVELLKVNPPAPPAPDKTGGK